jgi:hypothetical protein
MIFTNSKGYEYHIRLVGQEGDDPLTLDNIRIDHPDRPDMTLEEYFAFAGAEAERPYFEFMELEILDSLREGNGLEIRKDDLRLSPQRVRQHPDLPGGPRRSRGPDEVRGDDGRRNPCVD